MKISFVCEYVKKVHSDRGLYIIKNSNKTIWTKSELTELWRGWREVAKKIEIPIQDSGRNRKPQLWQPLPWSGLKALCQVAEMDWWGCTTSVCHSVHPVNRATSIGTLTCLPLIFRKQEEDLDSGDLLLQHCWKHKGSMGRKQNSAQVASFFIQMFRKKVSQEIER